MSFETSTLEEMCELIVDCPHSTPKWTDKGLIVLRNQNIKGGILDLNNPSYTNEEDFKKRIKRAVPQAGDIVFTREAPMGEVCIIPDNLKCCLGQRQVLLRPKKEVNGNYLFWALQSPYVKHQISWNEGTGSTVSNVRIPMLKSLNIPRHKSKESQIANILSSIANKITLNTEINQTLESIAQAIFKSWFVDFEPVKAKIAAIEAGEDAENVNRAAMRTISGKTDDELHEMQAEQADEYVQLEDTAKLFPAAMWDSELGEVPEGWEVKTVGEIVNRLKPKKRYTKKQVMPYGRIPVLEQGAGIILGYHDEEAGFIASPDKSIFIFGDHTCVTYLSCQPFDISQNVIPLEGKNLPTVWVYYAVKDLQAFQEYRRHWSEFSIKQVIVPDKLLSDAFSSFATSFYENKEKNITQCAELSNLRDTLLPKLLSGELSVEEIEIKEVNV